MMYLPLTATPAQMLDAMLGGQPVKLSLYQKSAGLFIDITVNGAALATGLICRDRVKLVRREYLGFTGDFVFVDTQGLSDPTYDGLGTRYLLIYLEAGDL